MLQNKGLCERRKEGNFFDWWLSLSSSLKLKNQYLGICLSGNGRAYRKGGGGGGDCDRW